MASNTAIYIYVGVSIIVMGVLAGFLINCNNKSCSPYAPKDMCMCSGSGEKICSNREESQASYLEGNTEYQDLAGMQKLTGGPQWKNTNFSNY